MEPAEGTLLKALFVSEKANNPYYTQHLKHSNRLNLRGLYNLSDFLPLVNKTFEELGLLIKDSPNIERMGPQLISLTADGLSYCQLEFSNAPDDDKRQPMGFVK